MPSNHVNNMYGAFLCFLKSADCTYRPLSDRLAVEIEKDGERYVIDMSKADAPPPHQGNTFFVTGYTEATEQVAWLGWKELIGVFPRTHPGQLVLG